MQARTGNVANHDVLMVQAEQDKRKKSRPPIGDLLFLVFIEQNCSLTKSRLGVYGIRSLPAVWNQGEALYGIITK